MSIAVNGVTRPTAVTIDPSSQTTVGAKSAKSTASAIPETGTPTKEPVALRFPWLSRLSSELEPVAKQKPAFPSTPITGDNVDQAV